MLLSDHESEDGAARSNVLARQLGGQRRAIGGRGGGIRREFGPGQAGDAAGPALSAGTVWRWKGLTRQGVVVAAGTVMSAAGWKFGEISRVLTKLCASKIVGRHSSWGRASLWLAAPPLGGDLALLSRHGTNARVFSGEGNSPIAAVARNAT